MLKTNDMTPHEKQLIHNYQFRIDAAMAHIDAMRQVMKDQDEVIEAQKDAITHAENLIKIMQEEINIVRRMQMMPTLN